MIDALSAYGDGAKFRLSTKEARGHRETARYEKTTCLTEGALNVLNDLFHLSLLFCVITSDCKEQHLRLRAAQVSNLIMSLRLLRARPSQ
jgi:hypothetical protein